MIVIHVARKPLIGSVAKNVLQYGTGGINIGACRIGSDKVGWGGGGRGTGTWTEDTCGLKEGEARPVEGRWPANLVMQHSDACRFQGQQLVDSSVLPEFEVPQLHEVWNCVPECPMNHLTRQGGSGDFFLQVQGDVEFFRAGGDVICTTCGDPYWKHPADGRRTFLNVLCDGSRVKL